MSLFDECFAKLPDFKELPDDYKSFWKDSLGRLKKIPQNVETTGGKSWLFGDNTLHLTYQGIDKVLLSASLHFPKRMRSKPPVVVVFPDYNTPRRPYQEFLEERFAVFELQLRGHHEPRQGDPSSASEQSYGYFAENLREKENYYLLSLYLDAYRSLEVLRLREEVDKSRIFFYGTGIGAAMALFVENFMPRALALALDRPAFVALELTQNLSQADYAREINAYLREHKSQVREIKSELCYFDALYLAQGIKAPVSMSVYLEDQVNIPQGAFSLFHALPGEKTMEVFPENINLAQLEKKKMSKIVSFFNKCTLP